MRDLGGGRVGRRVSFGARQWRDERVGGEAREFGAEAVERWESEVYVE